jgi:hypothetical protein
MVMAFPPADTKKVALSVGQASPQIAGPGQRRREVLSPVTATLANQ